MAVPSGVPSSVTCWWTSGTTGGAAPARGARAAQAADREGECGPEEGVRSGIGHVDGGRRASARAIGYHSAPSRCNCRASGVTTRLEPPHGTTDLPRNLRLRVGRGRAGCAAAAGGRGGPQLRPRPPGGREGRPGSRRRARARDQLRLPLPVRLDAVLPAPAREAGASRRRRSSARTDATTRGRAASGRSARSSRSPRSARTGSPTRRARCRSSATSATSRRRPKAA